MTFALAAERLLASVNSLNCYAITAAAFLNFFLGFLFHAVLFAKPWGEAFIRDKNDPKFMEKAAKKGMSFNLLCDLANHFLQAVIMCVILSHFEARTCEEGAIVGFLCWLAFDMPALLSTSNWEMRPRVMFAVSASRHLVALTATSALLACWPAYKL
eukprot:gnl/Hemi2/16003_TR5291_c0_g1_i1.p2 gnl/Hemi2/16003_TR5291_c0_g1~~gnl/Hemi2/16003_TR5291_c0_g1_i1.p2  ORF type:complete len:171 (+),score=68.44 gnl/Hemi2/16003_TR5291_c0_g1_i1:45-515(+)